MLLDQLARLLERQLIAVFLKLLAQLLVHRAVAAAESLDGVLGLRLEVRLAAVQMIETPRHFASDLHVRDLVFAHRHEGRAVQQDVRGLQQRVAQEPIGGQVLFLELGLLVLVARHALEPAERRDHRQQQVQLGVLGHLRLHEQRGDSGIQARRQPVDEHLVDEFGELLGVFVARGQGMPVRDEEIALVLVLEVDPVLERAMVVAKMQLTCRPHSGKNSFGLRMTAHVKPRSIQGVLGSEFSVRGNRLPAPAFPTRHHSQIPSVSSDPRPILVTVGGVTARSTTVVGSMPQWPPSSTQST